VKTCQIPPSRHTKSSISEPKTAQIPVGLYDKHGHKPVRSGNEIKYLPNPRDYSATMWFLKNNLIRNLIYLLGLHANHTSSSAHRCFYLLRSAALSLFEEDYLSHLPAAPPNIVLSLFKPSLLFFSFLPLDLT
jgi:hypothetical protein